ncbi:hypothetical protein PHAVU_004G039200 [Phaseolus vulgaris]|uniref:non-specific serine/threonine protein kinase n=1 Tax=Phaseolus vulgaris TaxID=3885 RepID=V7C376_PHAVU|nr:hypothetical protein PHAVU_004G039200g [Phaseolus vulgaris]ESW23346.1 hypothetical protein PHAVU_004G039200g [Phaseolus vulgaris]
MTFNAVIFLLLHLLPHLQGYTPLDNFTITCGSSGTSYDGQRTWTGDTESVLLTNEDATVSAKPTTLSPSTNHVPYATARLSPSQFSYSFYFNTAGPKFLRLFFFPASYPSFPRTLSSFSVHSNQFILLQDFNASLNADAENKEIIFKEYIVYVEEDQALILIFTPSQSNSYAFINGIEVLSMPSDLYYTSENDTGFTNVGSTNPFVVGKRFAMETGYRIKVGEQEISPQNDTGLFRKWAGDEERYFIKQNTGVSETYGKMNITVNPDYVAPEELYRTARNQGTNGTLNKISNLTWVFPVDCGFTYVLRLHFCELDPHINDIGDRQFFIYINSKLAEEHADVMKWSEKQKGLAVHRNYAVMIPKNDTQKKFNLSLQMHPYQSSVDTTYSDAFINGLEIFKMSDTRSNSLAGPNPDQIKTPQQKGSNRRRMIGITAGIVSGVVFISLVVFFVLFSTTSKWTPLLFPTTKSTNDHNFSLPSDQCRRFSLVEIKAATKNFDNTFIVGDGGFGHVYKGFIEDGSIPVAIKRLRQGSQQGACEFVNEIQMLSQLRHRHLVSLIGYCCDNKEMIIVYDFMGRGNLRDHLYGTDNPSLSWKERLKICIGAARGLRYLHSGAKHVIIHRDVKTTNILLDEKWVAKVSDFGLSKIGPNEMSKAHVSTAVKGSFGYLDPEYFIRQRLTEKSDVYSLGVVLFEVLCARSPLIHTEEIEQVSLAKLGQILLPKRDSGGDCGPHIKGEDRSKVFRHVL